LMPSLRGTGWGVEAQNRHHHHHQHWSNGTMINLGAQVLVSTHRPVHYYFHSKTWSSWSKPNLQSPISTEAEQIYNHEFGDHGIYLLPSIVLILNIPIDSFMNIEHGSGPYCWALITVKGRCFSRDRRISHVARKKKSHIGAHAGQFW